VERTPASGYNTRIREIPTSERPRERLRELGPSSLATNELLAIVLRTGWAEQSALSLASSLLARHGSLAGLARLSFAELMREKGLGEAKAAELQAVFQLALRLRDMQPNERPAVRSPADVYALIGHEMSVLDQEHLRVLLINTRNQLMASSEVYKKATSARPWCGSPRSCAKRCGRTPRRSYSCTTTHPATHRLHRTTSP
jgi:DNA repair protein RadC